MKHLAMRTLLVLLAIAGVLVMTSPATRAQQPGDPYADEVESFSPGDPANPDFGDPEAVLGPPDFDQEALSGFLNLGVGGSITVAFVDNVAVDGPGPDIRIHGDPDNDERWVIEVSQDGLSFVSFDDLPEMVDLDLADVGLPEARFVRLTDDGDPASGLSPGAELDAIEALNPPAAPREMHLDAVEPPEGRPGEELELTLRGGGFGDVTDGEVIIGEIEVLDGWVESDEAIVVRVFIPEDAPPGPRPVEIIALIGDEEFRAVLDPGFFVREREMPPGPGQPALYEVAPREVEQDSEVELTLSGDNFAEEMEVFIGGEGVEVYDWGVESPSRLIVRIGVSPEAAPGPRLVAVGTEGGQAELPDGLVIIERGAPPGPPPTAPPPPPPPTPPPSDGGLPPWVWAGGGVLLVGLGAVIGRALALRSRLSWERTAQLQWQLEAQTELPEPTEACTWACRAEATTDLLERWQVTALQLTPLRVSSGKTPPVKRVAGEVLDRLNEAARVRHILEDEAQTRQRVAPVVDALLDQIMAWKGEGRTPASIRIDARLARAVECQFKLYHCEQTKKGLDWVERWKWKGALHQPGGELLGVLRGPTAGEADFAGRARDELEGFLLKLVKGVRFRP